jgi:hypothetical protein
MLCDIKYITQFHLFRRKQSFGTVLLLCKGNENMENTSGNEESVKFDSSFDILASGIETNVLKAWKVVTMSEL